MTSWRGGRYILWKEQSRIDSRGRCGQLFRQSGLTGLSQICDVITSVWRFILTLTKADIHNCETMRTYDCNMLSNWTVMISFWWHDDIWQTLSCSKGNPQHTTKFEINNFYIIYSAYILKSVSKPYVSYFQRFSSLAMTAVSCEWNSHASVLGASLKFYTALLKQIEHIHFWKGAENKDNVLSLFDS